MRLDLKDISFPLGWELQKTKQLTDPGHYRLEILKISIAPLFKIKKIYIKQV
jgi:hypothetical protein